MKRLKMADIARMAGVSVSTVSRAMAGSPLIPVVLKDKINTIAQDNGYVVNHAARNLRLQTTQTIGLVLPMGHETGQHINDPFLLELIGALANEVTLRGYDMLLSRIPAPRQGWLKGLVQSHRFDGLLVLGQSDQHGAINDIALNYQPMVVWGEKLADQAYCSVGVDNIHGGHLAAQHLIDQGCKTLKFLGPETVPEVVSRYAGFTKAITNTVSGDLITTQFTSQSAFEAIERLIKSKARFDGIVCASDVIAQGAMAALTVNGFLIPGDVAVSGYDDVSMAKTLSPPLSTIRQDLEMGARFMVDLLFKRMGGEQTSSAVMPASLIVRGSSLRNKA